MKKLIIAEKPSVAKTIAKVVGADKSEDGYMEGNDFVVSWCLGHLLTNAMPDAYDPALKKWTIESLPIVPKEWKDEPITSSKQQLAIVTKLMKRRDIGSFVEATDAGREGELIFRKVYEYAGTNKPFERLWISSLEAASVRAGMQKLRPSEDYDNLYQASLARSRADWLFGINGTRFYTIAGCMGDEKATVGRVQTPTLAMIVKRQQEIDNFKVEKRYVIVDDFGSWHLETDKFTNKNEADTCQQKLMNQPVKITSVSTEAKKTSAPRLFSLTSLQRELNRKYGFTAQHTLDIIQHLYERKILSYPRTDAEYITDDMAEPYARIISNLGKHYNVDANTSGVKKVVNNSKVGDHYAIICTELYARKPAEAGLNRDEQMTVNTIVRRMLEAVGAPYEYLETKVEAECNGYELSGIGNTPQKYGWKDIARQLNGANYKSEEDDGGKFTFPTDIAEGKMYTPVMTTTVNRDTKPPAPYTEDTLLKAMERAGNKDMDKDVERKGIGTSATRAATIETLVTRRYIVRNKKQLLPTKEGIHLIDSVAEGFKSVSTTVEWENKLLEIEKGTSSLDCDSFCNGIIDELKHLISTANKDMALQSETVGSCPWCGGEMKILRGVARCESCGKRIYAHTLWQPKGVQFSTDDIKALLNGDEIKSKLLTKDNRTTDLTVCLDFEKTRDSDYAEWTFKFASHPKIGGSGELANCPICGKPVILENSVATCSGCGRKMYAGQRWMPANKSMTKDNMIAALNGDKFPAMVHSKSKNKNYQVQAYIDLDKTASSPQYYEFDFEWGTQGGGNGRGGSKRGGYKKGGGNNGGYHGGSSDGSSGGSDNRF